MEVCINFYLLNKCLLKIIFNRVIFLSLLQDLVNILKPFLDATELLSGSKYTTLSFVYPTMYYLMSKFAPNNGETDDNLFDLLYGPIQSENPRQDPDNEIGHEGGETNRGNK